MPTDSPPPPLSRVEFVRRVFRNVTASLLPVLLVGFFLANPAWPMSFGDAVLATVQRVLMLALAGAVVVLAGLFGMRLLRLVKVEPESLFARFVLGAGLGLGTVSLVTLAFGCAGLIGPAFSALVLGALFLVGIPELRSIGNFLRGKGREAVQRLSFFELLLVLIFLLVLLLQLVLAFNLPLDYDACEYHMAAPARWFQLGRIDYISGNVYSNFPMNCEMLYLFSLGLCGELMLGIHLAVVMNAVVAVLAAGAVYVLARKFFSRRAALAAMTLFFTMPWVMVTSTVNLYNEMMLAFYATLAVYAFLEFSETRTLRWAILSAVFAGLAAGVKYTALAFFPPVLLLAVVFAARGRTTLKRIGVGIVCAGVLVLVVFPWLLKNVAYTGNPTYPFFYRVFGGRDWSGELDAKWIAGQKKAAGTGQLGSIFHTTWREVLAHRHGSLAIGAFLVLGLGALRERPVRWLVVFLVLWTLFWYFFTHRVGRFWLPLAPCAAALAGRGFDLFRWKWVSRVLAVVLVGALGWCVFIDSVIWSGNAVGSYDLRTGNYRHLARPRGYGLYPLVVFAGTLEPSQKLMLVAEAQTLYLPPNVVCSTVFNREVFTSTVGDLSVPEVVREGLRRAGVTHVFVNWAEVGRLRATYTYTASDGSTRDGFPPLSPRHFSALVRTGVLKELVQWRFGEPAGEVRGLTADDLAALPGGKLCAVYAVH